MDARELLKTKIPDDGEVTGKVKIPVEFDRIYMLAGQSADEALEGVITRLGSEHTVTPQYRTIREKIGGMLYGFYINHSVEQQNRINESIYTVCDEFNRLSEEKKTLMEEINRLQMLLIRSEADR